MNKRKSQQDDIVCCKYNVVWLLISKLGFKGFRLYKYKVWGGPAICYG